MTKTGKLKFKNNLNRVFYKNGMSVIELAIRAGVSRQSVYQWLRGKNMAKLVHVHHLAIALGVSVEDLIGNITPEEIYGRGE